MKTALGSSVKSSVHVAPFLFAVLAFSTLLFLPHSTFADTSIASFRTGTAHYNPMIGAFLFGGGYAAQTFIPQQSGTVTAVAVEDGGFQCSVEVVQTSNNFNYAVFPTTQGLSGPHGSGSLYSGASFSVVAGVSYYIVYGCNNVVPDFYGSVTDDYTDGNAGKAKLSPCFFATCFAANVIDGTVLADWNFAVCTDSSDCMLVVPPVAPTCVTDCNSNVLFLPGIEGSRLYRPARSDEAPNTEHRLWEPFGDQDAQDLTLDVNGKESSLSYIYTRDAIDEAYLPAVGPNIYKSFIAKMNEMKDTKHLIADWATVPYDWRLSLDDIIAGGTKSGSNISYTATSPDPYIMSELMRLASSSRTHKVTIVAHSNGGLVAKALLIAHPELVQYVDRIFLVDVPQVGTPQAIASLLHGQGQGLPFDGLPRSVAFLTDSAVRTLAQNAPGAYNLLPSAGYFTHIDDAVVSFDNAALPDWVSRYGDIVHSQSRLEIFLTDTYQRVSYGNADTQYPTFANAGLLTQAETAHISLDDWKPPAEIQLIQIAGWGIPTTLKGIEYSKTTKPTCDTTGFCLPTGRLTMTASTTIDGDGTVVVPSQLWVSAALPNVTNYWVNLKSYNTSPSNRITSKNFLGLDHKSIFEVSDVYNFISDSVASSTKPFGSYIYLSIQAPVSTQTRLRYELHSPLTLDMYDSFGLHTGVSTTTGSVEEEIPGTYYMQFGDVKYLFTDSSTAMHIVMNGYATSTFTFNVSELRGDALVATSTFKDIPVTPQTKVILDTVSDIATLSSMRIDTNGDGIIDFSLIPKLNGVVTMPRPLLSVKADNKIVVLRNPLPALTATLIGFSMGDTASSSVNGSPLCQTEATSTNAVGIYPVICLQGSLSSVKYDFGNYATGTLSVVYRWDGLLQPINDTAHQVGQNLSVFKAGSTVPVKFQLKNANGLAVRAIISPVWLTPQKGSAMSALVDESIYTDPGSSGSAFNWDAASQQYVYNWSTKGFVSGYWYRISIKLDDQTIQTVTIGLK